MYHARCRLSSVRKMVGSSMWILMMLVGTEAARVRCRGPSCRRGHRRMPLSTANSAGLRDRASPHGCRALAHAPAKYGECLYREDPIRGALRRERIRSTTAGDCPILSPTGHARARVQGGSLSEGLVARLGSGRARIEAGPPGLFRVVRGEMRDSEGVGDTGACGAVERGANA